MVHSVAIPGIVVAQYSVSPVILAFLEPVDKGVLFDQYYLLVQSFVHVPPMLRVRALRPYLPFVYDLGLLRL